MNYEKLEAKQMILPEVLSRREQIVGRATIACAKGYSAAATLVGGIEGISALANGKTFVPLLAAAATTLVAGGGLSTELYKDRTREIENA